MVQIYTWLVLVTGVFFSAFGGLTFFAGNQVSQRYFSLLAVAFSIWAYAWFAALSTSQMTHAYFYAQILNAGATCIPILYTHWILSVLNQTRRYRYVLVTGYVATVLFVLLSFTSAYVTGVHTNGSFPFWPTAGWLYTGFVLTVYAGLVTFSLLTILTHMVRVAGEKRTQLLFILIGSLLGFGGGALNFPPMFGIQMETLPFIGILLTLGSPFVLGYAALQYHLLDIKVIATQMFAGVIVLIFVIDLLLAQTVTEILIKSITLLIILAFSGLQIRAVLREVHARAQIEELASNLASANERLRELDRQKSELLSIASHQLRTPLAAVKGYASMIIEGTYGMIDDAVRKPIESIFMSSSRMADTVEDFLNVSRIEQGKMEYRMKEDDLAALVQTLTNDLMLAAKEKGLELSYTDDGGAPYTVCMDPSKLAHVISNLIDNAIKYTPRGSVHVAIRRDAKDVVVAVSDTGAGIPPDAINTLFDKFVRARNANEVNVTGTGLGLYVARQMIHAHHGTIAAASAGEGKGATFTVRLPLST